MRPNQIRSQMVELGITNTQIAAMFSVKPQAVNRVIYGKSTSKRIQKAVAASINLSLEKVFPPKLRKAA